MTKSAVQMLDLPTPGSVPLSAVTIQLHVDDNVAIAKEPLQAGMLLVAPDGEQIQVKVLVPTGHKLALRPIAKGATVWRYGQAIGKAADTIAQGQHVHTDNLVELTRARTAVFGANARPTEYVADSERRTFMGYRRPSGKVGTRNYIAVISTVNCSAFACRKIAEHFTPERLAAFPNVNGVIALTHAAGCGGIQSGSHDYALLQRTLAGMVRHPNVAASVLVGLGCETNQLDELVEQHQLLAPGQDFHPPVTLMIQELGGTQNTIQAGIEAVSALLPVANAVSRTHQPLSELCVALECGGSDSWSGITANPLVGVVVDEIVKQGGTAVISETTEIHGAEHLLVSRADSPEVGQKLLDKLQWWDEYLERLGFQFDNNPAPGNKAGGLSNIVEKSLGAIAKGGTTNLTDVVDYAEPIAIRGFVVMDSPGFDPISVTGKVAGGCNLILFTTGRGSVFGFSSAPSLKIATNSTTYEKMKADMDFDAGRLLEEESDPGAVAADLLNLIIAVASGERTKSEVQGVGADEFVPWQTGGVV